MMIDLVAYCERVPGPGETLIARTFAMGFGGKGANQAVMAGRLGSEVTMVGCVGDDIFGPMTIDNLRVHGIEAGSVRIAADQSSGVAPIWVEPDGTNRILIVPGANDLVRPEDATAAIQALPHLDVVVGQLEIPQTATIAAFRAGRARGAITILNPAPAVDLDRALLAACDWCIPNESEFAEISRLVTGRACSPLDPDAHLSTALALGTRLLVTLGAGGACYMVNEAELVVVSPPPVDVIDTTGAGDAFVGAFADAIARGSRVERATRLALACASSSVQRPGTQASFPTRDDVPALVAWAASGA